MVDLKERSAQETMVLEVETDIKTGVQLTQAKVVIKTTNIIIQSTKHHFTFLPTTKSKNNRAGEGGRIVLWGIVLFLIKMRKQKMSIM